MKVARFRLTAVPGSDELRLDVADRGAELADRFMMRRAFDPEAAKDAVEFYREAATANRVVRNYDRDCAQQRKGDTRA